jgi:hypothetical protein
VRARGHGVEESSGRNQDHRGHRCADAGFDRRAWQVVQAEAKTAPRVAVCDVGEEAEPDDEREGRRVEVSPPARLDDPDEREDAANERRDLEEREAFHAGTTAAE